MSHAGVQTFLKKNSVSYVEPTSNNQYTRQVKTFYQVLINTLIAAVTNNFIWFAVTYWAYLETHSVLATSLVGGGYLVMTAVSGLWFGSVVDHNKKKSAMLLSSGITLLIFCLSLALYLATPEQSFTTVANCPSAPRRHCREYPNYCSAHTRYLAHCRR